MKQIIIGILFFFTLVTCFAQQKEKPLWNEDVFEGFKFRNIGPALMSGRISDIAIHPQNDNIWIVAVDRKSVV